MNDSFCGFAGELKLKHAPRPRRGPYERDLAQLAVYCLLLEEYFQCTVSEGIMNYTDRDVSVPFNAQRRIWILQDDSGSARGEEPERGAGTEPRSSRAMPGVLIR